MCTCQPGTIWNGWHEERCQSCLDAERKAWEKLRERWKKFLPEIVEIVAVDSDGNPVL